MPSLSASLEAQKANLRAAALAARDALSPEQRAAAAAAVAGRGLPFPISRGAVVSGYSPIRSEIDPIPLMRMLAAQGAQLPLPAFDRPGHRIGYGAGHYDYTLAHLRKLKHIVAVGLAFAAQEIKAVPA